MESGLLNWLLDDVESLSPSTFIEELEDNKKYSFSKDDFTQNEGCKSDDSLKSITSFAIISESNTDEEKNDIITTKKQNELDDTSLITNESYTGKSDELSILKHYIDAVDEAKHKISEIELVWPDYDIPDSYVSNTNIEKVVLLYANNYIKQFETKYPYRRQLLLVHENECGYQKCICTTIKPSILPYSDLCDLKSCSQFIANYMTYVPLSNPILVPKQVKSPALVLKNQTANCFELAILLVSFLIGRGYNAFVVQGYATEETCNNDFKNITLDLPSDENQSEENTILDEMDDEYSIEPPIDLCTDFVKTLMKDDDDNNDEDNKFVYDPLHRQRVHCWVIILPLKIQNKYISKELFFVEPSTGKICSISSRSYIGIEALWNNQNYWVNLQPLYGGCMQYNYTLMNTKCWEHFLIDEPKHLRRELNKVDDTIKVNKHLFMPNSWVTVLKVPRNMYLMIYPSGKKIIMYSNAVKELYADYIMPDGLVERITYYKKKDRIQKMFVKELYKHRADLLMRIDITYTDKGNEIVEYFRSGRKDCLKSII
ncbi:dynein regulatory complex subunit 7-like [Daktulosphaira vitifoliae]|uniref:dynein regulatory complex subunit 7-like n=1 Tax=Daktulosphaira vitifoliae TaxID=58002 RepID=UPI0021AACDA2|nr:dynein regulatory complex subunit 7-like [Daktulosphaira vitifoliae]